MKTQAMRALSLLVLGAIASSCGDPVRSEIIERLGGEKDGVPEGPEHRPGQPCLVCHSEGGPADDAKFVIAGTVFESRSPNAKGAADVKVFFVDSIGVRQTVTTNRVGNFYVLEQDWPNLTFPFKTGVLRGTVPTDMRSPINREGSCNACHKPNPGSPHSVDGDDPRESIGQIYAPDGTETGGTP